MVYVTIGFEYKLSRLAFHLAALHEGGDRSLFATQRPAGLFDNMYLYAASAVPLRRKRQRSIRPARRGKCGRRYTA